MNSSLSNDFLQFNLFSFFCCLYFSLSKSSLGFKIPEVWNDIFIGAQFLSISILPMFAHLYCVNFNIIMYATAHFLLYRHDRMAVWRKKIYNSANSAWVRTLGVTGHRGLSFHPAQNSCGCYSCSTLCVRIWRVYKSIFSSSPMFITNKEMET